MCELGARLLSSHSIANVTEEGEESDTPVHTLIIDLKKSNSDITVQNGVISVQKSSVRGNECIWRAERYFLS